MWCKNNIYDWCIIYKKNEDLINNPNHSHYDFFSFYLFHHNMPIMIDSGRGSYQTSLPHYNSHYPEYHNSILLNNLSYKPFMTNTLPKKYVESICYVNETSNSDEYTIDMYATGFNRINRKINFKREITLSRNSFIISDMIFSHKSFLINNFFHFDNSLKIDNRKKEFYINNNSFKYRFSNNRDNVKQITGTDLNNVSYKYGAFENKKVLSSENIIAIDNAISHKLQIL